MVHFLHFLHVTRKGRRNELPSLDLRSLAKLAKEGTQEIAEMFLGVSIFLFDLFGEMKFSLYFCSREPQKNKL